MLALAALLAGCGPGSTPEDEIRSFVSAAESAAEERDAPALRALVADDYEDPRGSTADDLRTFLHGWLIAHPSVHLVTRIESITLEGTELADVAVTVGMLGREAAADAGFDLAGDIWRLELRLAREDGGDWRVIRAEEKDAG